ncbi:RBBP9/YdeN family alpha/beta hydrolase [Hyphomicrobium sulfonivorans]|uniref:RBBP9/YdeN family alpha/beta hydrolase n=1 Tax=Hyphomicrobium sulfonivorans TaxID=121290 RepID=UPI00156E4C8C|nr:alpha/beta hydrolase [Hyphomicrobium sulfonivorans]MBI1650653.1 serine hydrolase family protein [Hyphomicrobium sulfonivorans]NSL71989.1 alpha/beta hydrolase [Hyphomicrobium sulfonivorans]
MKSSEVDILIVPGWLDSGPGHWQTRWEKNLKTAQRIQQPDWKTPDRDAWVKSIVAAVEQTERPAILVAHSLGVIAVAYAAAQLPAGRVAGAFLVAPADVDNSTDWPENNGHKWPADNFGFAPVPTEPLGFPALVLAANDDPYCTQARAEAMAAAWGAKFVDVGQAGHIAEEHGFGPWPDGLLKFGKFLADLKS